MANEWHYTKNGQRFGPVSGQQLKELTANGGIGPDDLVWKERMAQWVPSCSINELSQMGDAASTEPASQPSSPKTAIPPPGLMAVLVTQTVIAAVALLCIVWSIGEIGSHTLRSFNGLLIFVALGANLGVLATTWAGYSWRNYSLCLVAARLLFLSWLSVLLTPAPFIVSVLGVLISVPVGLWSVTTLRRTDVAAYLGSAIPESDFAASLIGTHLAAKWKAATLKQRAIAAGSAATIYLLMVMTVSLSNGTPARNTVTPPQTAHRSRLGLDDNSAKRSGEYTPPGIVKAKEHVEPNNKLLAKADELWSSGKTHEAGDLYQELLDRNSDGIGLERSVKSRVYSRAIDSLAERGGAAAVDNYIRIATVSRVSLVLSNPEARKLAADAASREQAFLNTPVPTDVSVTQGNVTPTGPGFYGEPRKDENGLWISGEEAYRREIRKNADALREQMRKGPADR